MGVYMKENGQLKKGAGLYKVSVPVGLADIYSTEEKEVGLWIDNKPLYKKTINCGTLPNNTSKTVAHGISNIDTIVNAYGHAKATANQTPIPFVNNTSVGSQVALFADATNITLRTSEDRSPYTGYVTILYTKTTDTPWSGRFVPQGYGYVSSGDIYSFEERQVGVYADGKPLYQKTMRFTSGWPLRSWATLANLSSLNIERLVKSDGIFTRSSGGTTIQLTFNGSIFPESTNAVQYKVSVRYNNNGNLECFVLTYEDITYIDVTLQYTKTTDVAGSGEYVPSGDRAKHYTADEHIVGTWTDGSTLYEKTVRVAANATGAITLWTDASVVVKDYDGRFVFRSSENSLSLYSRLSDAAYRAELSGIGNNTSHGVYADITLGTSRTNTLDIELTVRYIKVSS